MFIGKGIISCHFFLCQNDAPNLSGQTFPLLKLSQLIASRMGIYILSSAYICLLEEVLPLSQKYFLGYSLKLNSPLTLNVLHDNRLVNFKEKWIIKKYKVVCAMYFLSLSEMIWAREISADASDIKHGIAIVSFSTGYRLLSLLLPKLLEILL